MKHRSAALSLLALFIAGCATTYYHNNNIPESQQQSQFEIDKGYCLMVSRGAVPPVDIPTTQSGQVYTGTFNAGGTYGSFYGTSTPSNSFGNGFAQGYAIGEAISAGIDRQRIYDACMASKGWREVTKSPAQDEPPAAGRVDPKEDAGGKTKLASVRDTTTQPSKTSEQQKAAAELKRANQLALECVQEIASNPAYRGIARHMPLDGRKSPSMEQLTDALMPTDEEVGAIMAMHKEAATCREQLLGTLEKINPYAAMVVRQSFSANDLITADLIEKKISWGEANKRRVELKKEFALKLQSQKK